ncbi:MAG: hypothetical protein ABIL58_23385 [Pseudomonadota bacterium]
MKFEDYQDLKAGLTTLPLTWYPALIKLLVETACRKGVFVPGGAAEFVGRIDTVAQDGWRRDRDNPCDQYEPGRSQIGGDCETDGHYLCSECRHRNPDAAPDFYGHG